MPLYLIERTIPGAHTMTHTQIQSIAQKSLCAMQHLNAEYRWHQSYVCGNKLYCVHEAPSEHVVREHSRRGGFPIERVMEIACTISPDAART
jgi:hypothetical protein